MKSTTYLFLFLSTLFFPQLGRSQSGFEYGPRVGTSYSSFVTTRGFVSGGLGLVAGAMASYNLSESFQVIANLDYHQIRGGTQSALLSGGNFTFTTNSIALHTAEFSGFAAYRLPLSFLGSASLRAVGGGSVAYNFYTSNKRTSSINGSPVSSTNNEVVTDSFAAWLYAVQGGLQFEFPLDNGPFSATVFDFRYRRNMNPILNGLSLQGTGSAADIYSESFILTFGVKLK